MQYFNNDDLQQQPTTTKQQDERPLKESYSDDEYPDFIKDYSRRRKVPTELVNALLEDDSTSDSQASDKWDRAVNLVNSLEDAYKKLRPVAQNEKHAQQLSVLAHRVGIDPVLKRVSNGELYPSFKKQDSDEDELDDVSRIWDRYNDLLGTTDQNSAALSATVPESAISSPTQSEDPESRALRLRNELEELQSRYSPEQIKRATEQAEKAFPLVKPNQEAVNRNVDQNGASVVNSETQAGDRDSDKFKSTESIIYEPNELDQKYSQDQLDKFYREYTKVYSSGDIEAARKLADSTRIGRMVYLPQEDASVDDQAREAAIRALAGSFTRDEEAIDKLVNGIRLRSGGQLRFFDPTTGQEQVPMPGQQFNISLNGRQVLELANAERNRVEKQNKEALARYENDPVSSAFVGGIKAGLAPSVGSDVVDVIGSPMHGFTQGLAGEMRSGTLGRALFGAIGSGVGLFDEKTGADISALGLNPVTGQYFDIGTDPAHFGFVKGTADYTRVQKEMQNAKDWGQVTGILANFYADSKVAGVIARPLSRILQPIARPIARATNRLLSGSELTGMELAPELTAANAARTVAERELINGISSQGASALAWASINVSRPEAVRLDVDKLDSMIHLSRAVPEIKEDGSIHLRAENWQDLASRFSKDAISLALLGATQPIFNKPFEIGINNAQVKKFLLPLMVGYERVAGRNISPEQALQRLNQKLSEPQLYSYLGNGLQNAFQSAVVSGVTGERLTGTGLFRDFVTGIGMAKVAGSHRNPAQYLRDTNGNTYAAYYGDGKPVEIKKADVPPKLGRHVLEFKAQGDQDLYAAILLQQFGSTKQLSEVNQKLSPSTAPEYGLKDRLRLAGTEATEVSKVAGDLIRDNNAPVLDVSGNKIIINSEAQRQLQSALGVKLSATTLEGSALREAADQVSPELAEKLRQVPDGAVSVVSTGEKNFGLNAKHESIHTQLAEAFTDDQVKELTSTPEFKALKREIGTGRNYSDYELLNEALAYGVTSDPSTLGGNVNPDTLNAAAGLALSKLPKDVRQSLRSSALGSGRDLVKGIAPSNPAGLLSLNLKDSVTNVPNQAKFQHEVSNSDVTNQSTAPADLAGAVISLDGKSLELTGKVINDQTGSYYELKDSQGKIQYVPEFKLSKATKLNDKAKQLLRDEPKEFLPGIQRQPLFRDYPSDVDGWLKLAEQSKGYKLTQEEEKQLRSQFLTSPKPEEMLNAIEPFKASFSAFATKLYKAGLLSSPATILFNIASNTTMQLMEEAQRSAAAPLDMLLSFVSSKSRTVQGTSGAGIIHGLKGVKDGWKTFLETVKHGDPTAHLGSESKSGIAMLDKTIGNLADFVLRINAASDAPTTTHAYRRALYEQAFLEQKAGGRKIEEVLKNPTLEQSDKAMMYALETNFRQDNLVSKQIEEWKKTNPVIKLLIDYNIPFHKTGTNVFSKLLDYSGFTFAKGAATFAYEALGAKNWEGAKKLMLETLEKDENRRATSLAFGRGAFGLGIAFAGYQLAKAKLLFANYEEDDKEQQNEQANKNASPLSVRVGNRWVSIGRLTPIGTLLGAGAAIYRDEQTGDRNGTKELFLNLIQAAPLGKFASDLNSDKKSVSDYFIPKPSQLIPGAVKEIAKFGDAKRQTVVRDPETGKVDEAKSESARLKSMLPGQRQSLPAKTTSLGYEQDEPNLFTSSTPARTSPLIEELSRLNWFPANVRGSRGELPQPEKLKLRKALEIAIEQPVHLLKR